MEIGTGSSRITFGGLSTGLDTSALIEGLLGVERLPLERLQTRRDDVLNQQSLFREFNTLALELKSAAQALDNQSDVYIPDTGFYSGQALDEEFLAHKASSSDDSTVVATASGNATPGSYTVDVTQLATVGREVSFAVSDLDLLLGTGGETFAVSHGGALDISITVPSGGITLRGLRTQINDSLQNEGNVRAETIFDGTSYRLVISATETGLANGVSVTTDLPPEGLQLTFMDPSARTPAQDALVKVLGIDVTRPTNEITDAIPGVSLQILNTTELGTPASLNVTRDDDEIADGLQRLVDAVNAVRDFTDAQSAVDEVTGRAGPLSGDLALRQVSTILSGILSDTYSFGGGPIDALTFIGVSNNADGRLEIDREVLEERLAANALDVRKLLAGDGTDDGVATKLGLRIEALDRPPSGLIPTAANTETQGLFEDRIRLYEDRISILDLSIERFEARLATREETLIRRFAALESAVSRLQGQSSFLEGLSNNNR